MQVVKKLILVIHKTTFQPFSCSKQDFKKTFYDWSQTMCSNGTCLIWFMHHKTLKSSKLTQINANALAMSLNFILEIYIKFKGRKWCKLNHFRFWKIKKELNEEMSESRLMDYEERQEKDIISLKERRHTNMGNEAWSKIHQVCMEIRT